jgi:hypothetical protein
MRLTPSRTANIAGFDRLMVISGLSEPLDVRTAAKSPCATCFLKDRLERAKGIADAMAPRDTAFDMKAFTDGMWDES